MRTKYLPKREETQAVAVPIHLNSEGIYYEKWGSLQHSPASAWLVQNIKSGDAYTIDANSFARTYERLPNLPGNYVKTAPVWAERALADGVIKTREGTTAYGAGDVLVFNRPDGDDGYAMSSEKFTTRYTPAEDPA